MIRALCAPSSHSSTPPVTTRAHILPSGLSASYGFYGPSFELMVHEPREAGSEEYLHSEKYEVHHWDLDAPHSLAPFIGHLNRIRRAHAALQRNDTLRFHRIDNDQIWDYFVHRGGINNVGYPVSRTFLFMGKQVQFFQRRIVEI